MPATGSETYTPSHVANFFLDKAGKEDTTLSPLKLIKLVYLAYGWTLATLDRKLFDEPIEAWKRGPVIPSLYHEFKHFRRSPIEGRSECVDMESGQVTEPVISSDEQVLAILGKVWDIYKDFSAGALVNITHEDGSPWEMHYRENEHHIEIPDEDIKCYFRAKIGEYLRAAGNTTTTTTA